MRLNVLLALLVAVLFAASLTVGKASVPLAAWVSGDPRWAIIAELRKPDARRLIRSAGRAPQ